MSIGFESAALEGYYRKCGVPDADAKRIADEFGNNFIHLQAEFRQLGFGTESKATAAIDISDRVLQESAPINARKSESINEFKHAVHWARSAAICTICVSGYVRGDAKETLNQLVEIYADFLRGITHHAERHHLQLDIDAEIETFSEEARSLAAVSEALGKRKGIWTKIFG